MTDVTQILAQIEQGDPSAAEQLLPLVYDELRKLAAVKLANEQPGQTLQATARVHDAYLRLVDVDNAQNWNSRRHFFAAAAEAMRRILIEAARRRDALRHGGKHKREMRDLDLIASDSRASELLALNDALELLGAESPRVAQLVQLRYFAGLSHADAARILGVSRATADRDWAYAKAFLKVEITRQ